MAGLFERNTIVLFGADIDPVTLAAKNPQMFTLAEADSKPEANAVAVLDFQMPGAGIETARVSKSWSFFENGLARGTLCARDPAL